MFYTGKMIKQIVQRV